MCSLLYILLDPGSQTGATLGTHTHVFRADRKYVVDLLQLDALLFCSDAARFYLDINNDARFIYIGTTDVIFRYSSLDDVIK